jgi:hypothetical protein
METTKIKIFDKDYRETYKITHIEISKPNNKGLSLVCCTCNAYQLGGTGYYGCLDGYTQFDRLPLAIKQEVIKADNVACLSLDHWNIEIE